jgi:hypothetical protein
MSTINPKGENQVGTIRSFNSVADPGTPLNFGGTSGGYVMPQSMIPVEKTVTIKRVVIQTDSEANPPTGVTVAFSVDGVTVSTETFSPLAAGEIAKRFVLAQPITIPSGKAWSATVTRVGGTDGNETFFWWEYEY